MKFFVLVLSVLLLMAGSPSFAKSCSITCADGTSCSANDSNNEPFIISPNSSMVQKLLQDEPEILNKHPNLGSLFDQLNRGVMLNDARIVSDSWTEMSKLMPKQLRDRYTPMSVSCTCGGRQSEGRAVCEAK